MLAHIQSSSHSNGPRFRLARTWNRTLSLGAKSLYPRASGKRRFCAVSRGKDVKMNFKRLNKWAAINQFYIGYKSFRSRVQEATAEIV